MCCHCVLSLCVVTTPVLQLLRRAVSRVGADAIMTLLRKSRWCWHQHQGPDKKEARHRVAPERAKSRDLLQVDARTRPCTHFELQLALAPRSSRGQAAASRPWSSTLTHGAPPTPPRRLNHARARARPPSSRQLVCTCPTGF